jgi:hypothetical protein
MSKFEYYFKVVVTIVILGVLVYMAIGINLGEKILSFGEKIWRFF